VASVRGSSFFFSFDGKGSSEPKACAFSNACLCSCICAGIVPAYVSIRQHTSAYVSIRQLFKRVLVQLHRCRHRACIRQHTSAYVSVRQHTSAFQTLACAAASVPASCLHTSAYVTHVSIPAAERYGVQEKAYVSIRQHTSAPSAYVIPAAEWYGVQEKACTLGHT
jgi:hypothetical protein